ncbi:MAG: hypothetical protein KC944_22860, partial [Candidatus Omnitrophica bacterium]|nr:hypothetical protein [Candidatus Omnitrophota bacterium]
MRRKLEPAKKGTSPSVSEISEEWKYKWNPRDQMTQAMKWEGSAASTDNVGAVSYEYCLSCDGALSKRFEFDDTGTGSDLGALVSGLRYEYDGLNLLRVDEIYGASLSESGPWRTVEVSTHRPGQLSALLHKRVYKYNSGNNTATPNATHDFTYAHDPVGNVLTVFDNSGNEEFYFAQDAFGNELPINSAFGASDWATAAGEDYRIVEHQTGKWMDEFTGLYYFHAR